MGNRTAFQFVFCDNFSHRGTAVGCGEESGSDADASRHDIDTIQQRTTKLLKTDKALYTRTLHFNGIN